LKYDSAGTLIWSYTYNGTGSAADLVSAITVNANANDIYLTGASVGSATLFDYTTIKLNSSGTVVWNNRYNYIGADLPFDIDISGSNVLVNGSSQSTLADWDYAQVSYTTSGTPIDTLRTTGTGIGFDHATQAVTDNQGYVYITGTYANTSNGLDYKTIKLNPQGVVEWIATFDGEAHQDDIANSIGVDYFGNVYVTGKSRNSNSTDDYCTIKYNSAGTQQWVKYYNNGYHDIANKLIVGDDNNIYVTGESSNANNKDFATIAYQDNGDSLWSIRFNGAYNSDDMASNIEKHDGFIYVSGQSKVSATNYQYITIAYGEASFEEIPDPFNETTGSIWYYPNYGQLANDTGGVAYITQYSQNMNPAMYFDKSLVSYVFSKIDVDSTTLDTIHRIDMHFMDAENNRIYTDVYAVDKESEHSLNFYLPHCNNGVVDVKGNKTVFIDELYRGIDLYFTSNQAGAKHYFVLDKNSRLSNISIWMQGADSVTSSQGKFSIYSSIGKLTYDSLVAYEVDATGAIIPNTMQAVSMYADNVDGYWHFTPFNYNANNTLVIMAKQKIAQAASQPEYFNIGWSTYFGGSGEDALQDIKVDDDGGQYLGGNTSTNQFPLNLGVYTNLNENQGLRDAIALKFDQQEKLEWITYYGGSKDEELSAIAINSLNNLYAVGSTYSTNIPFPSISNGYIDDFNDELLDMMIFKLTENGYLDWSTYYGNDGGDIANDVVIDNQNNVYIVGQASAAAETLFVSGAYNASYLMDPDHAISAFIVKFNNDNDRIWASFIDVVEAYTRSATAVTCDGLGNVYATGYTYDVNDSEGDGIIERAPNLPPGYDSDLWTIKYQGYSNSYDWTQTWGDAYTDVFNDVICDDQGNLFFAGYTDSPTIQSYDADPLSNLDYYGVDFQQRDAFIVKIDTANGTYKWASYYGGDLNEEATRLALDNLGNIYVCGNTASNNIDFPTITPSTYYLRDAHNDNDNSTSDAFILKFNAHLDLEWTTYFGQNTNSNGLEASEDKINAICYQGSKLYYCGSTNGAGQYWQNHLVIPTLEFDTISIIDYWQPNSNSSYTLEGFVGFFDSLQTNNTIGIKEQNFNNHIIVYPNPTNDLLNINYTVEHNKQYNLSIINILGIEVYNQHLNAYKGLNKIYIDTKLFAAGSYIIRLGTENKFEHKIFIKN
jgi:hypothetical protein